MTSPEPTSLSTLADVAASDDAADRWRTITSAKPSDPTKLARIDTAARLADAAIAAAVRGGWARPDTAGADVFDASQAWARIALLWHQVLTDTDMFTAAHTSTQTSCRRDADAIRQWLASPDGAATVATGLGLDEFFDLYGFDKFDRLTKLLAAAQDAGIFGLDAHRVGIIHEAGDHGYVDTHRITLTTPQHGTLCSNPIDSLALFTDHLTGPDAATHALSVIADQVDDLLTQRALLAEVTWPIPTRATNQITRPAPKAESAERGAEPEPAAEPAPAAVSARAGRAFRPLAIDTQPRPATRSVPDKASRHGRRR